MTDYIKWLRGMASIGEKGVVNNVDARALGRTADELEYLLFFFQEADFGPAHSDVVGYINDAFTKETGKQPPEGFKSE